MSESGSDRKSIRQSAASTHNKKLSIQVEDEDDHEMKGKLLKNQAFDGPTEYEVALVERMIQREKTHAQWDKHAITAVVLGS